MPLIKIIVLSSLIPTYLTLITSHPNSIKSIYISLEFPSSQSLFNFVCLSSFLLTSSRQLEREGGGCGVWSMLILTNYTLTPHFNLILNLSP
jgi:hypothetical protein